MSPQFDIFDDNVKVRDHVVVEPPCARTNVDENVETLPERYAPRRSGLTGASEWCRMVRRTAQCCSSRFSRESAFMWASVLSPASVDGVCGGSHAHGNCTIVLRLTRGHRRSGDDSELRRELALSPPRVDQHQWLILTSDMTPLANVWGNTLNIWCKTAWYDSYFRQ